MNFTRAAQKLHITQPAVSQHIQYLEDYYGVKLFAVTRQLQAKIKEKVEYMTAMQVKNVNVSIRSLAVKRR